VRPRQLEQPCSDARALAHRRQQVGAHQHQKLRFGRRPDRRRPRGVGQQRGLAEDLTGVERRQPTFAAVVAVDEDLDLPRAHEVAPVARLPFAHHHLARAGDSVLDLGGQAA
jgi:hypothetical protein